MEADSTTTTTISNRGHGKEQAVANDFVHTNDLVHLPIIVTDYDAILNAKRPHNHSEQPLPPTRPSVTPEDEKPGFTQIADSIWNQMTGGMKQKLREACVEVLKRTEDASEGDKMSWMYDEDARFLD